MQSMCLLLFNFTYLLTLLFDLLQALKLHSYQSFDELLPVWSSTDWLRNFTWFPEEGLPKDKVLYQPMPEAYMDTVMVSAIEFHA